MDAHYTYRPLLDLIGKSEGTDRGRGFNETLAYGALTGGPIDLIRMTLDEIDALQTRMLKHPANRWNSSACGRYQIVRGTLRTIRRNLGLSGGEKFSAAMQDRMACFLLGRRGIDRYLAGRMSEAALIDGLAREWASLPSLTGKGYYAGQAAAITLAELRATLAECRHRAGEPRQGAAGIHLAISCLRRLFAWLASLLPAREQSLQAPGGSGKSGQPP